MIFPFLPVSKRFLSSLTKLFLPFDSQSGLSRLSWDSVICPQESRGLPYSGSPSFLLSDGPNNNLHFNLPSSLMLNMNEHSVGPRH